jgi:hypothetical protein
VIVAASTFTAQPVKAALEYWVRLLKLNIGPLSFAPYGQVIQPLLGAEGGSRDPTMMLLLLRWQDWLRRLEPEPAPHLAITLLERAYDDLTRALAVFRGRSPAPLFVASCPASPPYTMTRWGPILARFDDELSRQCADIPDTYFIHLSSWQHRFPVDEVHDSRSDALAHIPFTEEFFTVLGTVLARQIWTTLYNPVNTVVADADELCELDAAGARSDRQATLAAALRDQVRAGRQLLLAGSGSDTQVRERLAARPELMLRWAHVSTCYAGMSARQLIEQLSRSGELPAHRTLLISADSAERSSSRRPARCWLLDPAGRSGDPGPIEAQVRAVIDAAPSGRADVVMLHRRIVALSRSRERV